MLDMKLEEQAIFSHGESLSQYMSVALRAASAAGRIIRQGSGNLKQIEQKSIGDLVSEVDREADKMACEILAANSPFDILSEELNNDMEPSDDMWIVDPLDASSAFITNAGPQYPAVLVALRLAGKVDLGVVYFPLLDQWFYAQRGRGAFRDTQPLRCPESDSLNSVWVEMNHYGDAKYETKCFVDLRNRLRGSSGARLVTSNVPNSGVAMRIAASETALQAAIHDNNPAYVKQAAWDIAAPQIILEEAGGVFLNPQGNPSDPFVCEPIIVAKSRKLAESIIALIDS